jgi:hypothetical protein
MNIFEWCLLLQDCGDVQNIQRCGSMIFGLQLLAFGLTIKPLETHALKGIFCALIFDSVHAVL